jgi:hypothetical protein
MKHEENDTNWDDYHKQNGHMTNREFFSSNGKGGFYEGMEWDGEEWVPNQQTRERQEAIDAQKCSECNCLSCVCW